MCNIPFSSTNLYRFSHRVITRYGYTELDLIVSADNCGGESNIKYLEHVLVIIQARFSRRGYLEGYVISPSGTVSQILPYRPYDVIATEFNNWPILSLHFWGENPQGAWKLRFRNHFPSNRFSGKYYLNLCKYYIKFVILRLWKSNTSKNLIFVNLMNFFYIFF